MKSQVWKVFRQSSCICVKVALFKWTILLLSALTHFFEYLSHDDRDFLPKMCRKTTKIKVCMSCLSAFRRFLWVLNAIQQRIKMCRQRKFAENLKKMQKTEKLQKFSKINSRSFLNGMREINNTLAEFVLLAKRYR